MFLSATVKQYMQKKLMWSSGSVERMTPKHISDRFIYILIFVFLLVIVFTELNHLAFLIGLCQYLAPCACADESI